MWNRRQFLAAPAALLSAQTAIRIRQVDIVHHTHYDVGYTELPSVIRDMQKRYLDVAIDTCRRDPAFRWTNESLLALDDWWRAASQARRNQLLALVQAGVLDVMGMPFNQTPFLNAAQWQQMMSWIPESLRRSLNIRAAMQSDVNGMPRAGAIALLDRGIHHLLMGINADSGGPPFERPSAFWWKLPNGRSMFVWLGEHYGSIMNYLQPARDGNHLLTSEDKLRAAHTTLSARLAKLEQSGYPHDRLLLSFTNPFNYDNGAPFPSLSPFVIAWNKLGLRPTLRLVTATQALFDMEKAIGSKLPTFEGEWTDWWANGDASGPREVAASRQAKRHLTAAHSPVFGPMPAEAQPVVEEILRDLCLFDEHTWGAAGSVSQPYSLNTLGQYNEKSQLAYRPMGSAEALLSRRVRSYLGSKPDAVYVFNPSPSALSGWVQVRGKADVWVDKLAPHSVRVLGEDTNIPEPSIPAVSLDSNGWPSAATWDSTSGPLFEGPIGEFISTGLVQGGNRRTITQLHANPDAAQRDEIRRKHFHETAALSANARREETAHTLIFTQEIRHARLKSATRRLELWKREPRARIVVTFDRISSLDPEVFYIGFTLPQGVNMPVFSCGAVPFTPYRDQLTGSCRDYFAIDGWAHYASPTSGHWLWVTRDAPLVSIGSPHVCERHQNEPANLRRILAMVFDNCWHTNFVADSHGVMRFQFELVWRPQLTDPAALAESLAADPIAIANPTLHQTPEERTGLYRG